MAKSTAVVKKALAVASAARHDVRWASQLLKAARAQFEFCDCGLNIAADTLVIEAEKQVNSAKALLDEVNA